MQWCSLAGKAKILTDILFCLMGAIISECNRLWFSSLLQSTQGSGGGKMMLLSLFISVTGVLARLSEERHCCRLTAHCLVPSLSVYTVLVFI